MRLAITFWLIVATPSYCEALSVQEAITVISSTGRSQGEIDAAYPVLVDAGQAGNSDALNALGLGFSNGWYVPPDSVRALHYWDQAIDKKNVYAALNKGEFLVQSKEFAKACANWDAASHWSDHPAVSLRRADCALLGWDGQPRNSRKAIDLYAPLIKAGSLEAIKAAKYIIPISRESGQDRELGKIVWGTLLKQGDKDAAALFALLAMTAPDVGDLREVNDLLLEPSNYEHPLACLVRGLGLLTGAFAGAGPDAAVAFSCAATEPQLATGSHVYLGLLYMLGAPDLSPDIDKALTEFDKAAKLGSKDGESLKQLLTGTQERQQYACDGFCDVISLVADWLWTLEGIRLEQERLAAVSESDRDAEVERHIAAISTAIAASQYEMNTIGASSGIRLVAPQAVPGMAVGPSANFIASWLPSSSSPHRPAAAHSTPSPTSVSTSSPYANPLSSVAYGLAPPSAPRLYDTNGSFRGTLSANRYDPNSTSNPYGRYGSKYSSESINNPYSTVGSRYSSTSATNPYATNAPRIYDSSGQYKGKLSANPYASDSTSNPHGRYGSKHSPDSINNPYSAVGSRYSSTSATNPYATSGISIFGTNR